MRRPAVTVLVVVIGLVLLADLLVVNTALDDVASVVVDAVILAAAGAALAAAASLAWRRGGDIWRRRGDAVGAALVLVGIIAMLGAGLRPGATGAGDPAVQWLLAALLVPLAATLFGLLFVTTLAAARRSVATGSRDATVLVVAALITMVLVLPIGGSAGSALAGAASWTLAVPIGAVLRGLLLGIAVLTALYAARALLGIGTSDD